MMLNQPRGGHIFNIDGAGSDGRPTPRCVMFLFILSVEGYWILNYYVGQIARQKSGKAYKGIHND